MRFILFIKIFMISLILLFNNNVFAQYSLADSVSKTNSNDKSNIINVKESQNQNLNKINTNQSSVPMLSINIANGENPDDFVPAIKVITILTLLTFGPAMLLLMSSFTRILIVLSFLRQALGTPTMPPNQILIGLTLFLSYFVMSSTLTKIYDNAVVPYMNKELTTDQALEIAQKPIHNFMISQVRKDDLKLFYQLSNHEKPTKREDVPMKILIPSFVIGELKMAFQIGFLVYLPFIVIDMIVSSVLMAMGMMMLPPTIVSLPLKIILFVIADGWNLLVGSLVRSFN